MEVDCDTPRAQLKRSCFKRWDRDGDGFLNKAEMRTFAQRVGFNGPDEEWEQEFEKVCKEHSLDVSRGVPSAVVLQLMDDESDSGCYCTDSELREILDLSSGLQVNEAPTHDSSRVEKGGKGEHFGKDYLAPQKGGGVSSWDYGHKWGEYEHDHSGSYDGTESYDDRNSNSGHSGGHARGGDGRTVFFGGVPYSTTGAYLLNRFRTVGRVQAFWLFTWPNGQSRGMGLVQYQTGREAWAAVETLSHCKVDGRQLLVTMDEVGALNDIQVGSCSESSGGRSTGSSHGWGEYSDSYAKEEQCVDTSGVAEPWQNALTAYSPRPWATWGKGSGGTRFSPYGHPTSALTSARERMDPRRSVFFANVPYEFDEEGIKELFEEIGRIRSCVLFRTANNLSRGMGVVEYMTVASAARAYFHLHGYRVDGRRLVVDEYQNYG